MVLFDIGFPFNTIDDLALEVFHDDSLWNASSASEWQRILPPNSRAHQTVQDVLADVMSEDFHRSWSESYGVSPFSTLLVMHAVVVKVQQSYQVAQAFTRESLQSPKVRHSLVSSSLLDGVMRSLARCRELLDHAQKQRYPNLDDNLVTSMIFSCQATLRIANLRLFSNQIRFEKLTLTEDETAVGEAVSGFLSADMERYPGLLAEVQKSFEYLQAPIKVGHIIVRKTAAFRWSIEHALAGWDCG
ncbi:hypothetical protein AK830_g2764 [Neonectria ditissima]|uniref:Transcription factor domain-containing protein n=1 Tax=Neonectria ditissima TaxID=78410 RepID=A0A0P7BE23_9HYPO|nr:hypothetical protein AK830_g2764 [Neonectria ditissima]